MASHRWTRLLREAARAVGSAVARSRRRPTAPPGRQAPAGAVRYPGDFTGVVRPVYSPHLDGAPDPGEIVWTWVPFEEDHSRGKDRPVLLIGHDGPWLLALQLTSKDHDRDAATEARYGRLWMDIGSGPWDARGRPSEVRVNRVVRVAPDAVRREGAVLDAATFRQVVDTMSRARR
ncbi:MULTISPECIES: type II toxin-antitoxin system PemK/MazF family toxin [Isoptericola]|uniref:Type II toxin-antitoxin system PemK/MazF family toxin n=1 Tax=Isoptericola haloaureus TaxID=1542902 RepID=A0ABU7ZAU4_9MICO|nr:type II toxin-antitoxin system PemK/MazF family toxin [Isoptericola sp. AK164]